MTAQQVREEHEKALCALTSEQVLAIDRLQRAQGLSRMNNKHWRDNLHAIFATEAEQRSEPNAGHA